MEEFYFIERYAMSNVKQAIVMRKDLQMTKGKYIAQGSHASLDVILDMMTRTDYDNGDFKLELYVEKDTPLYIWLTELFAKVCLYAQSEEELVELYNKAVEMGLPTSLIEDAGRTMFHGEKTKTCIAIGPEWSDNIDKVTGHLKLL